MVFLLPEGLDSGEYGLGSQLLLDSKELVVLCGTLTTCRCTGLYLTCTPSNGKIRNGNVLRLSGPVGYDDIVSVGETHLGSPSGLGDGSDLVYLKKE